MFMLRIINNSLKYILASLILFGCANNSTNLNRSISSSNSFNSNNPKLNMFFIHGFLGGAETFGELDQILMDRYGEYDLKVKNITYPTLLENQEEDIGTVKFAQIVYTKIVSYLVENNISFNSAYSIVAHSQGGLVTMKYILQCIKNKSCKYETGLKILQKLNDPSIENDNLMENLDEKTTFSIPENFQHFISIGTPFWGSAKGGSGLRDKLAKLIPTIPMKQLRELHIGSPQITKTRMALIRPTSENGKWTNPFPLDLKIYNLSGDIIEFYPKGKRDKILSLNMKMLKREYDIAVDVASSRIDFYYYIEDEKLKTVQGKTNFNSTFSPFVYSHIRMPGIHIEPMVDIYNNKYGRNNPTTISLYKILDKYFHVKNEKKHEIDNQYKIRNLNNFLVELKYKLPKKYKRDIPIEFRHLTIYPDKKKAFNEVKLSNSILSKYYGKNKQSKSSQNTQDSKEKTKTFQTFYHFGKLKNKYAYKPSKKQKTAPLLNINYRFDPKFPGWQTQTTKIPVRASYSTYAEILLKPFLPISKPDKNENINYFNNSSTYLLSARKILNNKNKNKIKIFSLDLRSKPTLKYNVLSLKIFKTKFPETVIKKSNFKCYIGKVATQENTIHQGILYKNVDAINEKLDDRKISTRKRLENGRAIKILGRFSKTTELNSYDRYLVTSRDIQKIDGLKSEPKVGKKGTRWINVVDVDIVKNAFCHF